MLYYVDYRWCDDTWRADRPFSDLLSAQHYMEHQQRAAAAGINGTLSHSARAEFRIRAVHDHLGARGS